MVKRGRFASKGRKSSKVIRAEREAAITMQIKNNKSLLAEKEK
jgi:hypothetical protein